MSIRLIASIGVVLCVAMTTFSIYLGVVEHADQQPRTHVSLPALQERSALCFSIEQRHAPRGDASSAPSQLSCDSLGRTPG
jgi:hypothetical protein